MSVGICLVANDDGLDSLDYDFENNFKTSDIPSKVYTHLRDALGIGEEYVTGTRDSLFETREIDISPLSDKVKLSVSLLMTREKVSCALWSSEAITVIQDYKRKKDLLHPIFCTEVHYDITDSMHNITIRVSKSISLSCYPLGKVIAGVVSLIFQFMQSSSFSPESEVVMRYLF